MKIQSKIKSQKEQNIKPQAAINYKSNDCCGTETSLQPCLDTCTNCISREVDFYSCLTDISQANNSVIPWHGNWLSDFANSICPGLAYKKKLYIVDGGCFWWRRNSERNNTQLNTPVKHTPVKQATPHSQLLPTVRAAKGLP